MLGFLTLPTFLRLVGNRGKICNRSRHLLARRDKVPGALHIDWLAHLLWRQIEGGLNHSRLAPQIGEGLVSCYQWRFHCRETCGLGDFSQRSTTQDLAPVRPGSVAGQVPCPLLRQLLADFFFDFIEWACLLRQDLLNLNDVKTEGGFNEVTDLAGF